MLNVRLSNEKCFSHNKMTSQLFQYMYVYKEVSNKLEDMCIERIFPPDSICPFIKK